MTHFGDPGAGFKAAATGPVALEELDLSPQGLADAPASQQDPESIVLIEITD
jgi:hypothetical protein